MKPKIDIYDLVGVIFGLSMASWASQFVDQTHLLSLLGG